MKFEYDIVSFVVHGHMSDEDLVRELNELGKDGWEVVFVYTDGPSLKFILKR